MKKLFLASQAGDLIHSALPLFSKPFTETRLAVIPTAANPYGDNKPWFDDEISQLEQAGFEMVMIDIENRKEGELRKLFKDIDAIFVAGGNTYFLLFHARASGFDRIAKEMVNNGIPYIGSSAGALLAGKNIDIARKLDNPELVNISDFTGLGLVDYALMPHVGNLKYQNKIEETITEWQDKSLKIMGLTDTQALMIQGNYSQMMDIVI